MAFGLDTIIEVGMKIIDKVIPDPVAKADAQLKLTELAQKGEFDLYAKEQDNISNRWTSDMGSDSWLSKNIRPMTLLYILTAYLALAVGDGNGFKVSEAYVTLLGQWGMLVMGAYFGGRTLEKIMGKRD